MFLGNLAEAKARHTSSKTVDPNGRSSSGKSSATAATTSTATENRIRTTSDGEPIRSIFTKIEGFEEDEVVRLKPSGLKLLGSSPAGKLPVIYGISSDPQLPPREHILAYFQDCSALMMDESSLQNIIRNSEVGKLPLHYAAMEFQRSVMELNFQMEPNFGCGYLSKLPNLFPSDEEMLSAAQDFMFTALRSYLECVRLRGSRHKSLSGSSGFTRVNILEFFEACNSKMAMPETKDYLRRIYDRTKAPPGPAVIQIQRQLIEHFGVTADYGVEQLNKISTAKEKDMELMQKMQQFALCAQTATREATFTDAERDAFYAEIPRFMHHVPYMYAQQKQMQMQAEMQNQQAMMADQLQSLKGDPSNLAKMEEFSKRVKQAQDKVAGEVRSWGGDRREDYYKCFQSESLLLDIVNAGASLPARLAKFSSLTQAEIEKMMTLSAVINEDVRAGGKLIQIMSKGGIIQNVLQSWATIVRSGMQSLQSAGVSMGGNSMDHSHGAHGPPGDNGHVHGPNCSHNTMDHNHVPDVSTGIAATMER